MENIMKTSQEMKELVENFIEVTKIEYEDQTDKIKNKVSSLFLVLGFL